MDVVGVFLRSLCQAYTSDIRELAIIVLEFAYMGYRL